MAVECKVYLFELGWTPMCKDLVVDSLCHHLEKTVGAAPCSDHQWCNYGHLQNAQFNNILSKQPQQFPKDILE